MPAVRAAVRSRPLGRTSAWMRRRGRPAADSCQTARSGWMPHRVCLCQRCGLETQPQSRSPAVDPAGFGGYAPQARSTYSAAQMLKPARQAALGDLHRCTVSAAVVATFTAQQARDAERVVGRKRSAHQHLRRAAGGVFHEVRVERIDSRCARRRAVVDRRCTGKGLHPNQRIDYSTPNPRLLSTGCGHAESTPGMRLQRSELLAVNGTTLPTRAARSSCLHR